MYTTKDDAVQRLRSAAEALVRVAKEQAPHPGALDPDIMFPVADIREVVTWLDRLDLDDQADQLD